MTKYKVEALKDLQVSKNRVMTNVVRQIEQRTKPKQSKRWQYSILTVILTVCIGIFIYAQINNGEKLSANVVPILDENIYDLVLQDASQTDKMFTNLNFQVLIEMDAYYAYALSKGIKFSIAALTEQQLLERDQLVNAIKKDREMIEKLTKLQLSPEEFYDKYYGVRMFAQAELKKGYFRKNESSFQLHAYSAVKKEAMDYFTAEYGTQIAYLKNKYNVSKANIATKYKYGTVVAIEEDRFLVVTGALPAEIGRLTNEEMINKHTNGVWFPLFALRQKITIGQNVNVTYSMQEQLNQYDFVGDLEDIEISE